MTTPLRLLALAAALAVPAAHAKLIERGGGLVYDSTLNVTWLQDANYAKTSGFDADGLMTWDEASAWAAGLAYQDTARQQVLGGWRLARIAPVDGVAWNWAPTFDGSSDWSYNITSPAHEMAHLFHVDLGNRSVVSPLGVPSAGVSGVDYGVVQQGPFVNIQNATYWSTTASPEAGRALAFLAYSGGIGSEPAAALHHAWAVRAGDVGPMPAVPEPGTVAMLLAGLAVMAVRQQRTARSPA